MGQKHSEQIFDTLRQPLLYLLLLLAGGAFAVTYLPQPLLPSMAIDFGVSNSTIALLITTAILPLSVAPLVYGPILHGYPAGRVLLVSYIAIAVLGLVFSVTESFPLALALRLGQGLLLPAVFTTVMATISDHFRGQLLQKALSLYVAVSVGGSLFGRIWGGVFGHFFNWRLGYALFCGVMLLCLVPLLRQEMQTHQKEAPRHHVSLEDVKAILRNHGVCWGMLVEALNFFVFIGFTTTLPFRIMEVTHGTATPLQISLLYLGYVLAVFAASVSSSLSEKLGGAGRTVVLSLGGFVLSLPLMLLHPPFVLFIALCLICVFQFIAHGIVPGLINRMAPDSDTGMVNGLYITAYYMGGTLGTYIPSLLYSHFGWNAVLLLFASVLTGAIFAASRLRLYAPQ